MIPVCFVCKKYKAHVARAHLFCKFKVRHEGIKEEKLKP